MKGLLSGLQRSTGTYAILATSLVIVVLGLVAFALFRAELQQEQLARNAIALNARAVQLQVDEETGMRGFVATRKTLFLEPYNDARGKMGRTLEQLSATLGALGVSHGPAAVASMRGVHTDWFLHVAQPAIAAKTVSLAGQIRGKVLVDWFRTYSAQIAVQIDRRVAQLDRQTNVYLGLIFALGLLASLLSGLAIRYYGRRQAALQAQLRREREIVETLQRAFSSRSETLPSTSLGSAYLSATREANIGGDLFDVRRIDETRGYLLVADVSGKGFDAAVDTALIKYSVSALAAYATHAGDILAGLNKIFMTSRTDPHSFVVAFVGILDCATLAFEYASAGHTPAFVRREQTVEALAVTGPIVGLSSKETFGSRTLRLQRGDTIVLATDGLTEARDSERRMLTDEGAMRWIAEAQTDPPQLLVDQLVARLRAYVKGEVNDDLAILALRLDEVPSVPHADLEQSWSTPAQPPTLAQRTPARAPE